MPNRNYAIKIGLADGSLDFLSISNNKFRIDLPPMKLFILINSVAAVWDMI